MAKLAPITDTTADVPPALQREFGVRVVPASVAFAERAFLDGELRPAEFFARMRLDREQPRPFAVREAAFRGAFDAALAAGEFAVCLLMPFDVTPSFTTASAAMLSIGDAGTVNIKIANPGVASAGLCSLIASLSAGVKAGWDVARLLTAIDELEPLCQSLFVPEDVTWLERAGRLQLIEDRVGEVGDGTPVVRVGTRVSGVALEAGHEQALHKAVSLAGAKAGKGRKLVVTIDHADCADRAERVAALMAAEWDVARTIIAELSPTIGAQVGPGAIGIGVAPTTTP